MNTLFNQLRAGTHTCEITKNAYISPDTIYSTITLDRVKQEISRSWWSSLFKSNISECKIEDSRKVIALLVYTGDENHIEAVLGDDLNDSDLPLSPQEQGTKRGIVVRSHTREKTFSTFASWNHGKIHNLLDRQWLVLAPEVDFTGPGAQEISLHEKCALPFHYEDMSATDNSKLYKCVFEHVRQADFSQDDDEDANRNFIAVKKIENRETFGQEIKNLRKIQEIDHPHLIKHLAICKQASCIVFPWADGGNLSQLWKCKSLAQQDPEVFLWSLKQMAGLAGALECLHDDRINCRHGDLKPANILNFAQHGDFGTLKIADLGVSRVHIQRTVSRQNPTSTKASTLVYEAPEASDSYPDQDDTRSRTYDSWSLGCIMLEFVVWLLHGFPALEEFEKARKSGESSFYDLELTSSHNGSQIQYRPQRDPTVDEVIKRLKKDDRCVGTALEEVVDMIDKHLLVIKPTDRKKAVDIHESLRAIVDGVENGQLKLMNLNSGPCAIRFS